MFQAEKGTVVGLSKKMIVDDVTAVVCEPDSWILMVRDGAPEECATFLSSLTRFRSSGKPQQAKEEYRPQKPEAP